MALVAWLAYFGSMDDERRPVDTPTIATFFPDGAAGVVVQRERLDDAVQNYWLDTATTDELLGELDGIAPGGFPCYGGGELR